MLHFSDEPYRFFTPKPNRWVMGCAGLVNRWRILPRKLRITCVEPTWPDSVRCAHREGKRILFVPNHPSHSDSQTMFEVLRRVRLRSMFMAAYDAFVARRRRAWLLRRMGVFSVDRESSDKASLNQAIKTLVEGRYALTIFPEGNVYLQNDRVTPFHEGAFYIAWKALQELQKQDSQSDILVCPVSLKFTHMTDCRAEVRRKLHQAARAGGTEFDDSRPHVEEVRRVGAAALMKTLKQRGIPVVEDPTLSLPELIHASADLLIRSLEGKIGVEVKAQDSLIERIRRVRREVHRIRIDADRAADHEVAAAWASEAMTALRVASYTGQYLDHPTLDRFAETAEKLIEDIYSEMGTAYADRCGYVRVAAPISLSGYFQESPMKPRDAMQDLARLCESRVQQGIDEINAGNPYPGGQLFDPVSQGEA